MSPSKSSNAVPLTKDLSLDFEAVKPPTCDEVKREIELYGIYRDYLKHEDNLINNRLSWNFTIQGFLFAAYSLTLHKISDFKLGLLSTYIDGRRVGILQTGHALFDLQLLLVALALAGFLVSVVVYISVNAARIAVTELEVRWRAIYPAYGVKLDGRWRKTHGPKNPGLPGLVGGGMHMASIMGFHAAGALPLVIAGVWLGLLFDASKALFDL